ncbi:ESCRT-II complex subunit VPS25 [Apodemus speciosus]|uniref:Vacuolar protein-sorting-associated protein 25 n=1 Tax=Apodemus speciosus TaxID=105296 RepID=A0ABQ0FCV4_APOSI
MAMSFELQPNVDTRQKQLAAWCSLVLSFCRLHKQSSMTVMEAQESPLFNNVKLQRKGHPLNLKPGKLPVESIQIVLEELRKKGNLEWLDKNKSSFLIMWRRPEEWGKLIYQWVSRSGQNNSVFTLYELTNGEDTEDEAEGPLLALPTSKHHMSSALQPGPAHHSACAELEASPESSLPDPTWAPSGREFHGLDEATLLRALQALQQEHKAEIITVSDGRGVKFF